MRFALLAVVVLSAACHHGAQGPVLLTSTSPEPRPWITVSLIVAGSQANDNKRKSCLDEAHSAGIQLAPGAQVAATLYFLDRDDYLEGPGVPRFVFGAMGSDATCKLALGKLTKLDQLVQVAKIDPVDCKSTGSVEGSDFGFFHPGSYDAAVVEAQFKVRAAGGNRFVLDASRQQGTRIIVNGRGFLCPQ